MANRDYWQKRFAILEESQMNKGAAYFHELEKQYRKAAADIEKDLLKWYTRLAVNNEISMAEAKKLLSGNELEEFRWTVEEYIEKGRTLNYTDKWAKQLENASARVHISRLEAMKIQTQQAIEELYGNELDSFDQFMRDVYTEGYYRTGYEIQKGGGVGKNLMQIDKRKIDKVISKPWAADGSNFSSRIWKQKNQLVSELHTQITQAAIRGQTPEQAIKVIKERFNVSSGQAGRLVMTETAYFHSAGQLDMYKELGVEEYEITAVLDNKTSEICQALDGTHRPLSEFEPGVTAPPFHCWCRTTTVPYFDDEFTEGEMRAARDEETGKTYEVPSNMTYQEWKETFVDVGNKEPNKHLKLGVGSKSKNGTTTKVELGKIDVNDADALFDNFSEQIRNNENETAVVVDKNGNVFQFISDSNESVDLFDVDLDGAYILHNHPEIHGILSFGEDDFIFLKEHQNVFMRCCNVEYDYSVKVLKDISKLSYNPLYLEAMKSLDYPIGEDYQHIVFDILKKKGFVNYERKRHS